MVVIECQKVRLNVTGPEVAVVVIGDEVAAIRLEIKGKAQTGSDFCGKN